MVSIKSIVCQVTSPFHFTERYELCASSIMTICPVKSISSASRDAL